MVIPTGLVYQAPAQRFVLAYIRLIGMSYKGSRSPEANDNNKRGQQRLHGKNMQETVMYFFTSLRLSGLMDPAVDNRQDKRR